MSGIEIFRMFGSVMIQGGKETEQQLDNIDKKGQSVGSKLADMGSKALKAGTVLVTGMAAAGAGVMALAKNSSDASSRISDMSQKMGMSKQSFQEWDYILGQNGTSIDNMSMGMKALADKAVEGSSAFDELGVSVKNSDGSMKSQQQLFEETVKALQGVDDTTRRASLANDLLGRSSMELGPLLNAGADSVEQLRKQAHDLGLVMSDEAVDAGEAFGDSVEQLQKGLGGLMNQALAPLMPMLDDVIKQLISFLPPLMDIIKPLMQKMAPVLTDMIKTLLPPLVKLLDALMPILSPLLDLVVMIIKSGLTPLINLLSKVIASIMPGLTAAIKALSPVIEMVFGVVTKLFSGLETVFSAVGTFVSTLFGKTEDAAKQMIKMVEADRDAAIAATKSKYQALADAKKNELDLATSVYNKNIDLIDKELSAAIDGAKAKEKALNDSIQKRKQALEDEHSKAIDLIQKEYGVYEEKTESKTDIAREAYDKEVELATEAYDEKIKLLDDEYEANLRSIDIEKAEKIQALKAQIDAIKGQTDEENKLAEEQRNLEKRLQLEAALATETDAEKRKSLQKELTDFLADLERQKVLQQRESEIAALEQSIANVQNSADNKKAIEQAAFEEQKKRLEQSLNDEKALLQKKLDENIKVIQAERIEKENAENAKYTAAKNRIDKESASMDGWLDRYTAKLQEEADAKKKTEADKLKAAQDEINKEIELIKKKADAEIKAIQDVTNAKIQAAKIAESLNSSASGSGGGMSGGSSGGGGGSGGGGVLPGMATGGVVQRSGAAIVGENGPEILDFQRGARVTPLNGNSAGIVVNVNYPTLLNRQAINELGAQLVSVIRTNTGLRL